MAFVYVSDDKENIFWAEGNMSAAIFIVERSQREK
jgi:hypothetical protein